MAAYSTKTLRAQMTARGWSVGDLAAALGLPRTSTTPYSWLSGNSMPRTEMRLKLAELFTNGAAPPVITKDVRAPTIKRGPLPSDLLSFIVNTDGTATISLEATLPIDQALPLLRTLINAGVLANTKEDVSDE
jgi:transcriptional regulator with XRE-family HTH domain